MEKFIAIALLIIGPSLIFILNRHDNKPQEYKELYIKSWGDERYHLCEDLYDEVIAVTLSGDTIVLGRAYRDCPLNQ
jgi:hypothetical protein